MQKSKDSIKPLIPSMPSVGLLVVITPPRPVVGGLVDKGGIEAHTGNGGDFSPSGSEIKKV